MARHVRNVSPKRAPRYSLKRHPISHRTRESEMKTMNCLCMPKTKREGTQPYQVLAGMQPSRSGLRSLEEILSGTAPLGASLTASYKVQDCLGSYGVSHSWVFTQLSRKLMLTLSFKPWDKGLKRLSNLPK